MGDTKKQKKKYSKPSHPWQKNRILAEKELKQEYGLHNKQEIWKMGSILAKFKDQVKSLTVREGKQAELERKNLITKLNSIGLLQGDQLDQILGLEIKDILERRLQTIVFKKGLARSVKQARQFIIHHHITVNGKPMTVPSYLVKITEEGTIAFHDRSSLFDMEHPERKMTEKQAAAKKAKAKQEDLSRKLTEEEMEAKEIEKEIGKEEENVVEQIATETPEKEVAEIIEKGKTDMKELKK